MSEVSVSLLLGSERAVVWYTPYWKKMCAIPVARLLPTVFLALIAWACIASAAESTPLEQVRSKLQAELDTAKTATPPDGGDPGKKLSEQIKAIDDSIKASTASQMMKPESAGTVQQVLEKLRAQLAEEEKKKEPDAAQVAKLKSQIAEYSIASNLMQNASGSDILLATLNQQLAEENKKTEKNQPLIKQLENQIATLQKGVEVSHGKESELSGGWVISVIIAILIMGWLTGLMVKKWNETSEDAKAEAANEGVARVRLAKLVTFGGITFLVLVAMVTMVFAGINAALPPHDKEKTQIFFEIAKWVMGTLLPVLGAWVGGVLAYYFGKDSMKTGSEILIQGLREVAPSKLDGIKAGDQGLDIATADALRLAEGEQLDAITLNNVQAGFKNRQRLPILNNKGCPLGCLHSTKLNDFIRALPAPEQKDLSKKTLKDLRDSTKPETKWVSEKSFATVLPGDSMSRVQKAVTTSPKECTDVFVTEDGTDKTAVRKWITEDDVARILKA